MVSWSIRISPTADLANTMLDEAISLLRNDEHPVVHSDRGSHYRWLGWIDRMKEAGLIRSMSKKDVPQMIRPVKNSLVGLKTNSSTASGGKTFP